MRFEIDKLPGEYVLTRAVLVDPSVGVEKRGEVWVRYGVIAGVSRPSYRQSRYPLSELYHIPAHIIQPQTAFLGAHDVPRYRT